MERKTISALATPLYRFYLWPLIWLAFLLGFLVIGFEDRDTFVFITFVFLCVANSLVVGWLGPRVKKVAVDREYLYVSDYRKEVRIPLEEVVNVTEMRWLHPYWITIQLLGPSEFGEKIVFIPPWRYAAFWTKNELVEDLKQLARSKRPKIDLFEDDARYKTLPGIPHSTPRA